MAGDRYSKVMRLNAQVTRFPCKRNMRFHVVTTPAMPTPHTESYRRSKSCSSARDLKKRARRPRNALVEGVRYPPAPGGLILARLLRAPLPADTFRSEGKRRYPSLARQMA